MCPVPPKGSSMLGSLFMLLAVHGQEASTAVFLGCCVKSSCFPKAKLLLSSQEQLISPAEEPNLLHSSVILSHREQFTGCCEQRKERSVNAAIAHFFLRMRISLILLILTALVALNSNKNDEGTFSVYF